MKCPYNPDHDNTATVRVGDRFSTCPICGLSAKVVTIGTIDGYRYRLVKSGRNKSPDPKKVQTVRLSDSEMAAIEAGRLRLVVINKRITVSV